MDSLKPPGIATPLFAIVVIALVVFSAVGYYFLAPSGNLSQPTAAGTSSSTTGGAQPTLAGRYRWQFPCVGAHGTPCPVGFRIQGGVYSDYTTLLSGSGSFNITIDPASDKWTGVGQGSVTATTTGYCNGQDTVTYAFPMNAVVTASGRNVTIIFGTPSPQNATVNLSCTDTTGQSYQSSGTYQFISVFPDIVTMAAVPGSVLKGTSGNTNYEITFR